MKLRLWLIALLPAIALAGNIVPDPRAPFYPEYSTSGTGSLSSSTTVAASATHAASAQFATRNGNQVQIANTTSQWAYVQFGVFGSVTASTVATGYPVAPGAVVVVTVQPEVTGADVILGGAPGSATAVIFTMGTGN